MRFPLESVTNVLQDKISVTFWREENPVPSEPSVILVVALVAGLAPRLDTTLTTWLPVNPLRIAKIFVEL